MRHIQLRKPGESRRPSASCLTGALLLVPLQAPWNCELLYLRLQAAKQTIARTVIVLELLVLVLVPVNLKSIVPYAYTNRFCFARSTMKAGVRYPRTGELGVSCQSAPQHLGQLEGPSIGPWVANASWGGSFLICWSSTLAPIGMTVH